MRIETLRARGAFGREAIGLRCAYGFSTLGRGRDSTLLKQKASHRWDVRLWCKLGRSREFGGVGPSFVFLISAKCLGGGRD